MTQSILTTEDNSHTVFSQHFGAQYHSRHGAIEESMHVFISAGLFKFYSQGKKSISIFEMGMGTGLNVLLTYLEAEELNLEINYQTVESHPVEMDLVHKLNYAEVLNRSNSNKFLKDLHTSPWEESTALTERFKIRKSKSSIESYTFHQKVDLIYFDAFAPSCQPELWTAELHQKLYDNLNKGGILVTYCTQGAFRRNLVSLGYQIERLNGPGRKREMLRATKH